MRNAAIAIFLISFICLGFFPLFVFADDNQVNISAEVLPSSSNTSGGGGGGGGGGGLGILPPVPASALTPAQIQVKAMDVQKDGVINILDFNALMADWGSTDCSSPSNISGNCSVGIFDFNLLMVYWGATY